ncbi:hypothetical protein AM587_10004842 [Phytophthora nicotianae]|uniref:BZIP transcription factor 1 n=1 Tax=Phytophthora nicotianae TaxID=4792 RepID=A0A0W8CED1_PHYNI|nr:hypothetical protein AM587_10004842 [Phytophthora nicotianae]
MYSGPLNPPIKQQLLRGDHVIGKAMQKVRFQCRGASAIKIYHEGVDADRGSARQQIFRQPLVAVHVVMDLAADTGNMPPPVLLVDGSAGIPSRKRIIEDTAPATFGARATNPSARDESVKEKRQKLRQKSEYMKRYRKKITDYKTALEKDVRQLRLEIQSVREHCNTILPSVDTDTTVWNVVAEYSRLFRFGWIESTRKQSLSIVDECTARAQLEYTYSVMARAIVTDAGYGGKKLLETYRQLPTYLPDIECRLVRMEPIGDEVCATSDVTIFITTRTLQHAFPHLVSGDAQIERSPLATKLLGKQFVLRCSMYFGWDSNIKRVGVLRASADLLTPMLQLLSDFHTVSYVFKNALVTPDVKLAKSLTTQ